MLNRPTLIFDYDGTLHDSLCLYAPAVREACAFLKDQGYDKTTGLTNARIRNFIGMTPQAMWQCFAPEVPEALRLAASRRIGDTMLRLVQAGQARLYPGATEVLTELASRYRLVLLSNCTEAYLEAHTRHFALDRYFDRLLAAETFGGLPKWQILDQTEGTLSPDNAAVIGDRSQDRETAVRNRLPFIACAYGYGTPAEYAGAVSVINRLVDLPAALPV